MSENKITPEEMNKALFSYLLNMLAMTAMQDMGKIKNPATDKVAIRLEAAQLIIDLLDMLELKTRGNRDADEEKMIKDVLSMLKINFVETRDEQLKQGPNNKQKTAATEESNPDKAIQDKTSEDQSESKEPKFRKTYE